LALLLLVPAADAHSIVWYAEPASRMNVAHSGQGMVDEPYEAIVTGMDGRSMYGAEVRVYYNDTLYTTQKLHTDGRFEFTPIIPGTYLFIVEQGRYNPLGGLIEIAAPAGWKPPTQLDEEKLRYLNTFR